MEKLGSSEPARLLQGGEPNPPARAAGIVGDEATRATRSKLSQCSCMSRWLPAVYREELWHVLRLTGPLVLSRILNFLLPFVVTIFCGHIGNAELAGYALASATINVTTTATGHGLAVACDTLISQTFGSRNLKRVGVILQRSSIILVLFCLPCWGLLLNSQHLLILMLQDQEVARIAQLYVMVYLPAVPAMFLHQLQVAYLQNQGIIMPQMYTAAAANLINVGVNYYLIIYLELGVVGSAIASSLSQITICLLLFIYIRWKKLYKQTWDGWSMDCLQDWSSYMKLAVPSFFMVCLEWWVWEIGSFLAGIAGEEDLAAQHILVEIGSIGYMFPLGIQAAACVRVGNALGAGNTKRALITCKVALTLAALLAVVQAIVITCTRTVLGKIFTTDANILGILAENLKVYIFLQFIDALLCVSSGVVVGAGMQKIAAYANLVCYYCIGLPVGVALIFVAKLRILGFWLGILMCVFLEAIFFIGVLFKLNWKKATEKAQKRAGMKCLMTPSRPASTLLSEAMLPDIPDQPGASTPDGYSPVDVQNKEVKAVHDPEASNAQTGERNAIAEQNTKTSNNKSEVLLSTTQLILRRGLVVVISVLVLTLGVIFHFVFPPPEFIPNFNATWANDSTPTMVAPFNLTSTL